MNDSVFIEGLKIPASIGIFDWEKVTIQNLYIDCEVELPLSRAGLSDSIDDTLSYAELANFIYELVSSRHYDLIEHLAEHLIAEAFERFPGEVIHIKISKPGAVPEAKNVGIKLSRARPA